MRALHAPIVVGLVLAVIGFMIGAGVTGVIRVVLLGRDFWSTELSWSTGYPVALIGWLFGVGGWKYWGREWFGLDVHPFTSSGWKRYFDFSTDHKVIGIQYIVTFAALFLLSGLIAMLIRIELAWDGLQLFDHATYNRELPRHYDGRGGSGGRDRWLRQFCCAADDRRTGHGVPAPERSLLLVGTARRSAAGCLNA